MVIVIDALFGIAVSRSLDSLVTQLIKLISVF